MLMYFIVAGAPSTTKIEQKSPSKPNFFANLLSGGNKSQEIAKPADTELKKIESPVASADSSAVMSTSQVSSQSGSDKTLDTSTVSIAASTTSAQTAQSQVPAQQKQPEENKAAPHAGDKPASSFVMESNIVK